MKGTQAIILMTAVFSTTLISASPVPISNADASVPSPQQQQQQQPQQRQILSSRSPPAAVEKTNKLIKRIKGTGGLDFLNEGAMGEGLMDFHHTENKYDGESEVGHEDHNDNSKDDEDSSFFDRNDDALGDDGDTGEMPPVLPPIPVPRS
ncbi:MAG: hypothetical protein M1831_003653 [Alyxoria varia]|nr:MAG: hypothetical protein M1831_003653 [Alyxoria varia]